MEKGLLGKVMQLLGWESGDDGYDDDEVHYDTMRNLDEGDRDPHLTPPARKHQRCSRTSPADRGRMEIHSGPWKTTRN